MKRKQTIVPVLCTLLLLGTGVCMPQMASLIMDHQLERDVVQREDSYVSLALSETSDLFRTLELFDAGQAQINLTDGYQMRAEDVIDAVEEARYKLMKAVAGVDGGNGVVDPKGQKPISVQPVLIANRDTPSLSGVFWNCVWYTDSGEPEVLWLDDKSGKMVAFLGHIRVATVSYYITPYSENPLQDIASSIAGFCRTYYSADDVRLSVEAESDAFGDYTLVMFKDGGGEEDAYPVSLRLKGDKLYFNL